MADDLQSSSIGFFSSQNATNDSTLIFKTTNAGGNWSRISAIPTMGLCLKIQFLNASTGFIVVDQDGLYKTIDGGVTWIRKFAPDQFFSFASCYFPSPSIGYLIGAYDSIYKSVDAGETWNAQINTNSTPFYAIYFIDDNNGYIVGGNGFSQGLILKTIDGGINWAIDLAPTQTLGALSFPSLNIGYTCGSNGAIYKLDLPIGITENSNLTNDFRLFPSPATSTITMTTKNSTIKSLKIYNVLGEEVMEMLKQVQNDGVVDVSSFTNGIYFVEVLTEKGMARKKFVKE